MTAFLYAFAVLVLRGLAVLGLLILLGGLLGFGAWWGARFAEAFAMYLIRRDIEKDSR